MINFPLWRAAAIGQSGFDKHRTSRRKKNFVRRWALGVTNYLLLARLLLFAQTLAKHLLALL